MCIDAGISDSANEVFIFSVRSFHRKKFCHMEVLPLAWEGTLGHTEEDCPGTFVFWRVVSESTFIFLYFSLLL
ncbi:hypothetical protein CR201_G0053468 [Pongo abelii]|uniref:Uncharacterized protein n=1 Tax=Pongo abelii TaxID=9601 RepID=A0A2J8R644_PONAB|nr:hypothetical protein CR201_G0053468 [Pongo abelii]